jgi:hypothetical protein
LSAQGFFKPSLHFNLTRVTSKNQVGVGWLVGSFSDRVSLYSEAGLELVDSSDPPALAKTIEMY